MINVITLIVIFALGVLHPIADARGASSLGPRWMHARSLLPSSFPTYYCNSTACVTFPNATFSSYCEDDSSCNALTGPLNITVSYYTNDTSIDNLISSWPDAVANGSASLTRVSDFLEFQLVNFSAKADAAICNETFTCVANLTIPLSSNYSASKASVCLRLEPNATGRGYTALGYPSGSNGTSISSLIVKSNATCYTSYFGKHAVYQYTVTAPPPPSSPPPSPPPPRSPPPPPPTNVFTTLPGYRSFYFEAGFTTSFDTLKANTTLLQELKEDVASAVATNLAAVLPALFAESTSAGDAVPAYERVEVYAVTRGSTVVLFRIWILDSATTANQELLLAQLLYNTTDVFSGSSYQTALNTSYTKVLGMPFTTGHHERLVIGIVVGVLCSALIVGVVFGIMYRSYLEVLPKPPKKQR